MDPIDGWQAARASGKQMATEGFNNLRDYALAMIKLKPRSDAFYQGMKGSLQCFYQDLQAQRTPRIDLEFGAHLVNVCEQVVKSFKPLDAPAQAASASIAPTGPLVTVIGGTGFTHPETRNDYARAKALAVHA